MYINTAAKPSAYSPVSLNKANQAAKALWNSQIEQERREALASRYGLSFDELDASSAAAQSRVKSVAQAEDISKLPLEERLALLKEEGRNVDRTGMSDKEVLEEIHARFEKYLTGEDEWPVVGIIYEFPGRMDIQLAYNEEQAALREAGWSSERIQNAYSEMYGVGGMSADEKKSAIAQKFADKGPMTHYRFQEMLQMMTQTGADKNAARLALYSHFRIKTRVDAPYLTDEASYKFLDDENYYEKTLSRYKQLYHEPIGFSGISDNLLSMTEHGGFGAEMDNAMKGFIELFTDMKLL